MTYDNEAALEEKDIEVEKQRSASSIELNEQPPKSDEKHIPRRVEVTNSDKKSSLTMAPEGRKKKEKLSFEKEVIRKHFNFLDHYPPPPYPTKEQIDRNRKKFLETLQKLEINMPFLEMLNHNPKHENFLKEVLSNKKKLADWKTIALSEECSAVLQKKLPPKLKNSRSFIIPCEIGGKEIDKELCDLGVIIILIPLLVLQSLETNDALKPTNIILQFTDRSLTYPHGIMEDVLVTVGKFVLLVDFVVLDIEEDKDVPIILRHPFLDTEDGR